MLSSQKRECVLEGLKQHWEGERGTFATPELFSSALHCDKRAQKRNISLHVDSNSPPEEEMKIFELCVLENGVAFQLSFCS